MNRVRHEPAQVVLSLAGFASNVVTVVAWISGSEIVEGLRLGAPTYAGLLAGGTALMVGANWQWLRKMYLRHSKKKRFGRLSDQIQQVRSAGDSDMEWSDLTLQQFNDRAVEARVLRKALADLRITIPEESEPSIWSAFLVDLEALSRTEQLKEARSLYKDWQGV